MNIKMLLLPLVFCLLSCLNSNDKRQAGTTDTGNIPSILGRVTHENGTGIEGLKVILNEEQYLSSGENLFKKSSLPNTSTDKQGFFQFPMQRPGTYLVEATDGISKSVVFKIHIESESQSITLKPKPIGLLQKVQGQVDAENMYQRLTIQVYGMERLAQADSITGEYELLLPSGDFGIKISASGSTYLPYEFKQFKVSDSIITRLPKVSLINTSSPYFQWKYTRQISINTLSFHERALKFERQFPLYLKLDSTPSNYFDFSQAKSDGSDLRFSNSKGEELPYEIEYWNSDQKTAHIWVLVDTVFNLNDSQYISLYSGNPSATSRSLGSSTFTSIAGAYHFSASTHSSPFPSILANSSSDRDNFIGIEPQVVEGKIHTGLKFNSSDQLSLESPSDAFLPSKAYTISFWLRLDSSPSRGSRIVSLGNNIGISITADGRVQADFSRILYSKPSDTIPVSLQSNTRNMDNGIWRHITFRITENSADLFIDGQEDTALIFELGSIAYRMAPIIIGKNNNLDSGSGFKGEIDELRISPLTRSIFWNLLNFESQNLNRKIITLRKLGKN